MPVWSPRETTLAGHRLLDNRNMRVSLTAFQSTTCVPVLLPGRYAIGTCPDIRCERYVIGIDHAREPRAVCRTGISVFHKRRGPSGHRAVGGPILGRDLSRYIGTGTLRLCTAHLGHCSTAAAKATIHLYSHTTAHTAHRVRNPHVIIA
jgi:hypothetical protein